MVVHQATIVKLERSGDGKLLFTDTQGNNFSLSQKGGDRDLVCQKTYLVHLTPPEAAKLPEGPAQVSKIEGPVNVESSKPAVTREGV